MPVPGSSRCGMDAGPDKSIESTASLPMKQINRKYSLGALSVFLVSSLILLLVKSVCSGFSLRSWNLSEWLINYSGGLNRRGLPGAGLLSLSQYTNTSPYWWVLAICLIVLGVTVWIVERKSRCRFHSYILFSPILFGGTIIGNSWFRKDIIGVLFLIGSLKILLGSEKLSRTVSIGLVNALSSVMILSHEAYGFYALPMLILVNAIHTSVKRELAFSRASVVASLIDFTPTMACLIMTMYLKGNEATAMSIHQSWAGSWFPYDSNTNFPKSPTAAINSIGWTTQRGLRLSFSLLKRFSHGIYVPLAWATTLLFSAGFIVNSMKANSIRPTVAVPAGNLSIDEPLELDRGHLSLLLFLQLIAVSPLFVLGWDYGRWIFLWSLSSIVFFLYTPPRIINVLWHIPIVAYASNYNYKPLIINLSPYYLLIFAVPRWGWTVESYVKNTPLISLLRCLWQILR
jgi:hypothetical protein